MVSHPFVCPSTEVSGSGVCAMCASVSKAMTARLLSDQCASSSAGGGTVRRWRVPAGAASFMLAPLRVDSGVKEGDSVGTFYDPMIAKLVVHAKDRCVQHTAPCALGQSIL